MAEKIGIYVCHCGSNIAGTIDVEEVARWAGKNIKDVVVSKDYKFMCSSLGQQMIEDDIKEQGLTGVVVGACSPHLHEKTFRSTLQAGRPESLPLPDDQPPRARLLGQRRQGGRHGEGQVPDLRRGRARQASEAAGTDEGQGQSGHAGRRRRHRRLAGHAGIGRRRIPRLSGRARAVDRRAHGPVRQDLPHAGLLGVHSDAENVGGRAARERHHATPTPSWRRSAARWAISR